MQWIFGGNLKGKLVEKYDKLWILYIPSKNLYEQMCYICLLHIPSSIVEDVYVGLKKLGSCNVGFLRGTKAKMLKWIGKEAHV